MHLPKLPTVFVKDGEERNAYYTVEARELLADGWEEKRTEMPKAKPVARTQKKAETPKKETVKKEAPKAEPKKEESKPKTQAFRSINSESK